MGQSSILILGDGLLSTEIVRQTGWDYISRKKDGIDFNLPHTYASEIYKICPKIIINCIANTSTYSDDRDLHWNTNYKSVKDLIDICNIGKYRLVHISTDYIYANSIEDATETDVPATLPNWYSYTKLLADGLVQLMSDDYLLLRTTFKPTPYKYDVAWGDLIGNFDYVDVISKDIIYLIENNAVGIYNIGTERKSMIELAKKTNLLTKHTKIGPTTRPYNTTMNCDKLKRFKNE